jgi:hypothetical protein
MNYREKIEAQLEVTKQQREKANALLDALSSAYDEGGSDAVTAALNKRMKDLEREFHKKLKALEETL